MLTVIDQITKLYATKNFQEPSSVIGDFFTFRYAENTGVAFSIPVPALLLIILTIFLLAGILYFAKTELNLSKKLSQTAIALIFAGGLSNLIDRLIHGYVIDFISIGSYPIFNIADVYISVGVLLVIAFYGKIKRV